MIQTPQFFVTYDPLPGQVSNSPEYQALVNKIHKSLAYPNSATINSLRNAIERFPDKPELYNYLFGTLEACGEMDTAEEVLEQTLQLFPDYLFGRSAKAGLGLKNDQLHWVPRYLGAHFDLNKLYPNKTVFHISEVLAYYHPVIKFLVATNRITEASDRFEILKMVAPQDEKVLKLGQLIVLKRLQNSLATSTEDIAKRDRKAKITERPLPAQTTVAPEITIPEMAYFYAYEPDETPLKVIKKLLQADRSLVIPELKKVLHDGVDRFNYFYEQEPEHFDNSKEHFLTHALYWVGFLQAEELLEDVLFLLTQDEKVVDYWFGDYIEDLMMPVLVNLGPGNLPALRDIVLMPNLQTQSKETVIAAVTQIAMHQEHLKPEVLQWFHVIFDEMLNSADDENLFDSGLMGAIIYQLTKLRATEFLPKIKIVLDRDLVPHSYAGDWEMIQIDMAEPRGAWEMRPLPLDIFEYYSGEYKKRQVLNSILDIERLREKTNYDAGLLEDLFSEMSDLPTSNTPKTHNFNVNPPQKSPPTYNKVGRNEPCPCGSGKKFKRCHGMAD